MKIGVLGSGVAGQAIASKLVQLNHEVMMGSRDEANPRAIAWAKGEQDHHALTGNFMNAAAFGEILFNCTVGAYSLEVLKQAGAANLKGKILIDISNPLDKSKRDFSLLVCNNDSLGEQIQRAFPETKVVKTLNTVNINVMLEPEKLIERTDVFLSGNDIEAKATVKAILKDWFGWKSVIDLGDITTSRGVEMFLPLWQSLRRVLPEQRFNIKIVKA